MQTLAKFSEGLETIPAGVTWYLADIAEAKGKQDLYTKQSPQKLRVLREHALVESAVSSNRIEGVEIDRKRIGTIIFGSPLLKDRNEEEIQGYRDALTWIHAASESIHFNEPTIKKLRYLADIAEAKGKQDLYTNQSPQDLRVYRSCLPLASATSARYQVTPAGMVSRPALKFASVCVS